MENLLPFLFLLACPLGMGLMMWMMMRATQPAPPSPTENPPQIRPDGKVTPLEARPMSGGMSFVRALMMCLDWRVLVALALVGLGIWVIAPQWILPSLPILLLAACPLSMLVMALLMARSKHKGHAPSLHDAPPQTPPVQTPEHVGEQHR